MIFRGASIAPRTPGCVREIVLYSYTIRQKERRLASYGRHVGADSEIC
jgi:hypothetical protein